MSIRRSGSSSSGGRSRPPTTAAVVAAIGLLIGACGGSDDPAATESADQDATDQEPVVDTTDTATEAETEAETAPGTDPAEETDQAEKEEAPEDPDPSVAGGFEVQAASWEACGDLQCAAVTVPADHDDPAAGTIDLALVRVEATGNAVGSILVNPGGPGASGVGFVRGGFRLDDETMSRYHLVGFDPRGIGGSAPLGCSIDRATGPLADLSPDSAAEARALDAESQAVAEQCAAAAGDRLGLVGTNSVVADLELLRRAVGDDRLNYIGFSYGTLLGLRYADRHPTTVGRMVLDGLVDPSLGLPGLLAQQADAFERAFERLDAACDTGLDCPEGGIAAAYDRIRAELEQSGPQGEVGTTEFELATLVTMYSPALRPSYVLALAEADRGNFVPIDGIYGVLAGGADYGAYAAVSCHDSPHPVGADAWDEFASELTAAAPRFGAALANEIRACAHWPTVADTDPAPVTAAGTPTVLLIGTTGDPATPVENARIVADTLASAALVIYDGEGHTAYASSPCTREVVARHFAEGVPAEASFAC